MMRLLTGTTSPKKSFEFEPLSVADFGSTVLVEGCDLSRSISWVHAWPVADGIITQVREFLNTSLTVTRFRNTNQSSPSNYPSLSSINCLHCTSVWVSRLPGRVGKSVSGRKISVGCCSGNISNLCD
ncbi:wound-induced protein 1-like isoform X1 [Cornus florida]|uniref:wound-induced protein 1-like isoform X1 n=1 Tax=Cornus florida TaxID=4283 RepID=UPI00289B1DAA|nr:wound-induced protein 1-like isoform X1 [Cornus florida]XP_059666812.1 wound-induced protein 1-like isoform X1 [Cornus florida]XP_059666813.1 wound-induced protein 1-like isoform X1 [Cornus florida]